MGGEQSVSCSCPHRVSPCSIISLMLQQVLAASACSQCLWPSFLGWQQVFFLSSEALCIVAFVGQDLPNTLHPIAAMGGGGGMQGVGYKVSHTGFFV